MGGAGSTNGGPDFVAGVPFASLVEGEPLLGQVEGEPVLLTRIGKELFAVSGTCTHYGGPLAEGRTVGDTVRCPWHHACFSLRTGEALAAPALNPIACWDTERLGAQVVVRRKRPAVSPPPARVSKAPESVVIVGAGAAGAAAAEMVRRLGYQGPVTLLGEDESLPYDRPNLSKDYLAGNAPEEWIPLRPPEFYAERGLVVRTGARVVAIEPRAHHVKLADGESVTFGTLLLATGARPVRLSIPGADLPHVRTLRSLADSRELIARLGKVRRAVVLGAGFLGLEVAASLRARGLEVDVVAPGRAPLERVLGTEVGHFLQSVHEGKGVRFHFGQTATAVAEDAVILPDGKKLEAQLVVMAAGVRPDLSLAERAGLAVDRGVSVNGFLETSAPGIYAAGDLARWPDARSGDAIRVEHWVVAQRQGQVAAENLLGARVPFRAVPFFWSVHHDVSVSYVGHAEHWESVEIDGDLKRRDATVRYLSGRKLLAVATIGRDKASLDAQLELERS